MQNSSDATPLTPLTGIRSRPSLHRRVSIGLGVLLVGLAAAQFFATYWVFSQVTDESEQQAMLSTAPEMAELIAPLVDNEPPDFSRLNELMRAFTKANPKLQILLLNKQGKIIASFAIESFELMRDSIPIEPVERIITQRDISTLPIYGADPEHATRQTIFSAARLTIGDEPGYLYVNLRATRFQNLFIMSAENFGVKTIGLLVAGSILFIALFGFSFLRYLNFRLSEVLSVVRQFGRNDFSRRAPVSSNDEIAHLADEVNLMADRIEQAVGELKDRDFLRRQLIANVSHDLRGPVANIRGILELLDVMPETQAHSRYPEFHNSLVSSTASLQQLLNGLFELAKFEAHERAPERLSFDIAELLEDAIIGSRGVAESLAVQLILQLPEEGARVIGDPEMLRRALQNLIENAIYYSRENSKVTVSLERTATTATVSITDQGVGIASEELERIMARFEQGSSSAASRRMSSGLGLSIAQQILKSHESTIEVESIEEKGSTFRFSLPLDLEPSETAF